MNTETQILLGMALALMFIAAAFVAYSDVTAIADETIMELFTERAPDEVNVSNNED